MDAGADVTDKPKTRGEIMLEAAILRAYVGFYAKVVLVVAALGCAIKYIVS
jgi:hypothetical protein